MKHSTTFITRQGDNIEHLAWHPTGKSILVATDTSLTAFERYQVTKDRLKTTLLENTQIKAFWISQDGRNVYFLGDHDDQTGIFSLHLTR